MSLEQTSRSARSMAGFGTWTISRVLRAPLNSELLDGHQVDTGALDGPAVDPL